jgi:hypothetical protein
MIDMPPRHCPTYNSNAGGRAATSTRFQAIRSKKQTKAIAEENCPYSISSLIRVEEFVAKWHLIPIPRLDYNISFSQFQHGFYIPVQCI